MAYEKQTVATRLQRRYMSELIEALKELDDDISAVMYSGLWLDIDTIADSQHINAKRYLNDIINTANNLIKELDTKDIDLT